MRWMALAWACLSAGFVAPPAWAQAAPLQSEGLQWLQRVAAAPHKLNFSGTFVYRNGTRSETSRIAHLVSNGNQMEKIEVLDGSPREFFRFNEEISCYLPESRLVIVEKRSVRRGFPALLPASLAGLNDLYQVSKGSTARIAGFDSQIIRLEPRDGWRYGHQLWVDIGSGLLLKAEIFNERGEALESMAFTDLRIGETIRPETLKPRYATLAKDKWQIRKAKLRDLREDTPWIFSVDLPGFRKQAALRRSMGKDAEDLNMLHWVFSDGLVALSVFISPLRPQDGSGEESMESIGALGVVKRVIDGHQLVVMGDVPLPAIGRFAEGIGVRGK